MTSCSSVSGNAFQSARTGIQRGLAGLNRDASATASATVASGGSDLTGPMVDSLQQRQLTEASARALSIADQTMGSLIDAFA